MKSSLANIDEIIQGDALELLKQMPDTCVSCCITSPPYWRIRNYGIQGQLGLEKRVSEYVSKLVDIFDEIKRVLSKDGTLWLNLGDTYASGQGRCRNPGGGPGSFGLGKKKAGAVPLDRGNISDLRKDGLKPKDLAGVPWRVAFALQERGWYLRQDIIWHKPNAMPESAKDRLTKSHEYMFLLSKNSVYYFDYKSIMEKSRRPGESNLLGGVKRRAHPVDPEDPSFRNGHEQWNNTVVTGDMRRSRSVWTVATKPYKEAHFATYPEKLIRPCVLAGCPPGGIVLDPFMGAGTTALVALKLGRHFLGFELNPESIEMAERRLDDVKNKREKL